MKFYQVPMMNCILCCLLLTSSRADPDPKKYKSGQDVKLKQDKNLTNEEKKFLREIEAKFGVKSEIPDNADSSNSDDDSGSGEVDSDGRNLKFKAPFPAVIAIEIVNDTNSKSKGKRTIDANLGYGYKTNEGYSYSYFGNSGETKGKYMIYPYSQHDIPPRVKINTENYAKSESTDIASHAVDVQIQPSQAYELVEVGEEQGYNYERPSNPLKTSYEEVKQSSLSYENETPTQTLYTTYDGHQFSGLSNQFPTVMPNYFVDPKQILRTSQYQNAGIAQNYLSTHNSHLSPNQGIVPVLVLRVPSSFLRTPTAELYADLPKNYPLSHYINDVSLQQLVNQYFKKHGFSFAPQIRTYQTSPLLAPTIAPESQEEYSNSYISRPTYTSADYSGVHYSAVKPAVAKYPISHQQYVTSQPISYQQPIQYQYKYQYEPQANYEQVQYQQDTSAETTYGNYQNEESVLANQGQTHGTSSVVYEPQYSSQEAKTSAEDYGSQADNLQSSYQVTAESAKGEDYGPLKVSLTDYNSPSEYYTMKSNQNSVSVVPSRLVHTELYNTNPALSAIHGYQQNSHSNGASTSYVMSDNYPSKLHTIATALPFGKSELSQNVQSVSYVTPTPSIKYQSQYQVMVPQTVLKYPGGDKLYNANRLSAMHYLQKNPYGQTYRGTHYKPSKTAHPPMHFVYAKRNAKPKVVVSKTVTNKSDDNKASV